MNGVEEFVAIPRDFADVIEKNGQISPVLDLTIKPVNETNQENNTSNDIKGKELKEEKPAKTKVKKRYQKKEKGDDNFYRMTRLALLLAKNNSFDEHLQLRKKDGSTIFRTCIVKFLKYATRNSLAYSTGYEYLDEYIDVLLDLKNDTINVWNEVRNQFLIERMKERQALRGKTDDKQKLISDYLETPKTSQKRKTYSKADTAENSTIYLNDQIPSTSKAGSPEELSTPSLGFYNGELDEPPTKKQKVDESFNLKGYDPIEFFPLLPLEDIEDTISKFQSQLEYSDEDWERLFKEEEEKQLGADHKEFDEDEFDLKEFLSNGG